MSSLLLRQPFFSELLVIREYRTLAGPGFTYYGDIRNKP